ncbi:uncharacterized protein MONOS_6805 [Monocercomonoides exilis]|uniref:uncharacterized protein n=1 Tax=Monocercomonoides exilis TaxID=2049356 RepID=UPI00355AAB7A|nr:hypothetical protein MONOS_6805 [Monocercomonoides exilis]|eukprot:MONOS_6805.1-p1 / transcript=MONOS_6805.1 / gene=MONOS_6805 / organism=Monocercomonoides_exilis_PA203 / gene_product=unspecified product / transcript_product=unspecified product / location=Mono_scaffold00221:73081-73374(+) / protein_length=80 / sequence_SO=supercontig / SO=protein_coding / is_pseudo=false
MSTPKSSSSYDTKIQMTDREREFVKNVVSDFGFPKEFTQELTENPKLQDSLMDVVLSFHECLTENDKKAFQVDSSNIEF